MKKRIPTVIIQTLKNNPVVIALVILVIVFSGLYPDRFLTSVNFEATLRQFVTLMLFGLGPSMVLVTGSLDLSYVGIWMLGGILLWYLVPVVGLAAIGIFPLLGVGTGFLIGVIQTKAKIPSFILTLSLLITYWGLTALLAGGQPRAVAGYGFLTSELIPHITTSFLLAIPLIVAAIFVMKRTKIGNYLCAIGSNEEGARLAGINVDKFKILTFTISGIFTGVGSMILFQHLGGAAPVVFMINTLVLPLVAIVLGGTPITGGSGGPHRTILGALTLSVLYRGLLVSLLPAESVQLLVGILLVVAVIVGTRGLKGVMIT